MTWLTWRQFRTQALIGLGLAAVVAAVFLATRGSLLAMARDSGYTGCTADCDKLAGTTWFFLFSWSHWPDLAPFAISCAL